MSTPLTFDEAVKVYNFATNLLIQASAAEVGRLVNERIPEATGITVSTDWNEEMLPRLRLVDFLAGDGVLDVDDLLDDEAREDLLDALDEPLMYLAELTSDYTSWGRVVWG